jgi:integrase
MGAERRGLIRETPYDAERVELPELGAPDVGEGFTADEVQRMISDPRIPADRRVLYALEFLTGQRTGEAAARRWRDWDRDRQPLGAITVDTSYSTRAKTEKATKTKVRRTIPVHPVLAMMLAEWHAIGWLEFVGRAPEPGDLIAPLATGEHRPSHTSWRDFRRDLEALGLAPQRHYESRSTFISVAEGHGADPAMIARMTHPSPKKAKDLYRRVRNEWPAMCAAVQCIPLQAPPSLSVTTPLPPASAAAERLETA